MAISKKPAKPKKSWYPPIDMWVKGVITFATPTFFFLFGFIVMEKIRIEDLPLALMAILIPTAFFVRGYLRNVISLTEYVDNLAGDRIAEQPDLGFMSTEGELSAAVEHLGASWERKKVQLEAMLSEREVLVDSLPDMLVMLNHELQIVRTNYAARSRFGQNLANHPFAKVVAHDALHEATRQTLKDGKRREMEIRLPGPPESYFRTHVDRFPVHSPGGISIIVSLHDISAHKKLELMLSDFVANASHEIRTPLASIIGYIETLQTVAKDDPEAHEKFLKIMSQQAERMRRLVDDLLSLSRLEMSAHTQPDGRVDLEELIAGEVDNEKVAAEKKNISLKVTMPEAMPELRGDYNELRQVAQNLISNAVKYGNRNSEVAITLGTLEALPDAVMRRHTDDARHMRDMAVAYFSVRDEGEGIAPEHIPRLTERFYRVDSARTRKAGGTGLGLAIVKFVIQRHRGVLDITSEVGKGSVFTAYFPLTER